MQPRFSSSYSANVLLQDIIEKESFHSNKRANIYYLTKRQRLDLCIEMMKALDALHKSGVYLGGSIAISDIMPQQFLECKESGAPEHIISGSIHKVNIRIPAHANKSIRACNYEGWEAFSTVIWEKDIVPGDLDAKTDVCLFGRIFLQLWFVDSRAFSDDQQHLASNSQLANECTMSKNAEAELMGLLRIASNAKLPKGLLMSEKAEAELLGLLRQMNEPMKDDRPTTTEVIERLDAIRKLEKNTNHYGSPMFFMPKVLGAQVSPDTKSHIVDKIYKETILKVSPKLKYGFISARDREIIMEEIAKKISIEPPVEKSITEISDELSENITSWRLVS